MGVQKRERLFSADVIDEVFVRKEALRYGQELGKQKKERER